MSKKSNFQSPQRSFPLANGTILGAKIDQNRTQTESKFKTIFDIEKIALQEPHGAVLSRSWAILEATLGSNMALRYTRACVW